MDSGREREAGPLVDRFVQQFQSDTKWRSRIQNDWMAASNACLDYLMGQRHSDFGEHFSQLSDWQASLSPWLIPDAIRSIWQGDSYRLKICGAGGGGFMLGYSSDWEQTRAALAAYPIYKV